MGSRILRCGGVTQAVMPLFMAGVLCVVAGCYTNRVHGVLPRTGELFMSTRSRENNGGPIFLAAAYEAPTIIVPLVCVPVALGVGILDQCVCSPVWDMLCMPADLAMPTAKMKIVNSAGEPVTNSCAYCVGKHEANKDAIIQFKLMRTLGDPARISVEAPGYTVNTYSVPRDNEEHTYVLLTQEELVKKRREDDIRRREGLRRCREEMELIELECAKRDNKRKYWALILQGSLERLKKAEFHYDDLGSEDFKTETRALSDCRTFITSENLDYLFSLMERRPELAHEWSFLYGARAVQVDRLEANRAFALKLAEDKKTARPLLAVIDRYDTPEEYWRMVMENPKLAYCRTVIEDRVRHVQKWRKYWDQQKKKKQEVGPVAK